LFPTLVLTAPLLVKRPTFRWIFAVLSVTLLLNLWWVDPALPSPSFAENITWGLLIAAVNSATGVAALFAFGSLEQVTQNHPGVGRGSTSSRASP
jgi:hypothetical protein